MSGWISLHRKVLDNAILKRGKSYSNFEGWIWLLLRANYEERKVLIGAEIINVKQGR